MEYLLLPFTHGVDVAAISYACSLAQQLHVTIMPLSLIRLHPSSAGPHIRLTDVEQSTDFLEFALHKARRVAVPVNRIELHTHNTVGSIRSMAQEMDCAVLLFVQKGAGVLLTTHEVKELLADRSLSLYVVNLPPKKSLFSLPQELSQWFQGTKVRQGETSPLESSKRLPNIIIRQQHSW